jgi:hypothetical protein
MDMICLYILRACVCLLCPLPFLYDKKFQFFFSLFPKKKKKKKKNEIARADIKTFFFFLSLVSRASDFSLSLTLQATKEFPVSRLFFVEKFLLLFFS